MLRLHLLGYTYLSQEAVRVPISSKALALITFLTLEDRPHHREYLANLLWNTPHALRNLRVELTHVRKLLPHLIPAGQPMLGAHLPTDLEAWLHDAHSLTESNLNAWLSVGSGLPLSGLEDVGMPNFQGWVDERRWDIERQVELALSGAYAAFVRRGLEEAAKLTLERIKQLGLHYQPDVPIPQIGEIQFERPELHRNLQGFLTQAKRRPQLILLRGRSGSGRRNLLEKELEQSDWVSCQMQASPHLEAHRAAFLHQVVPLLTSEPQGEVRMLLTHTHHSLEDMVRAWTLLAASGQAVVVIYNGVTDIPDWLLDSWHFAMNLPFGLALVLISSPMGDEDHLKHSLGSLDHLRVHTLQVPPLTVQEIMPALQKRHPHLEPETCRALSTLVLQQSGGWPVHARDLLATGTLPEQGYRRLSLTVRDRLLSDLSELRPALRKALMRLSMAHSSIDQAVGELLLGTASDCLLEDLERLGLLRRTSDDETVGMPTLEQRPSDLDDGWRLPSEALRVALAGSLTSTERREINRLLARHYQHSDPLLAQHYARRGGLNDLINSLQAQAIVPEAAERAARTWEPAPTLPFPEGSNTVSIQRCTANGYCVALEDGQLIITRAASLARSPLLRLRWPAVTAGYWHLVLRLDTYSYAPEFGLLPPAYALGVQPGSGKQIAFTPDLSSPVSPDLTWGGPIPLGRWFTLRGQGGSGPLELSVRAMDIALSIGVFEWGGVPLLPSTPQRIDL